LIKRRSRGCNVLALIIDTAYHKERRIVLAAVSGIPMLLTAAPSGRISVPHVRRVKKRQTSFGKRPTSGRARPHQIWSCRPPSREKKKEGKSARDGSTWCAT